MVIQAVDVTSLDDGVYAGSYKKGRFTNEVKVTVKEHIITNIEIVKQIGTKSLTDGLVEKVMEAQQVTVYTVSGATATSKAFLKSIELALNKEQE